MPALRVIEHLDIIQTCLTSLVTAQQAYGYQPITAIRNRQLRSEDLAPINAHDHEINFWRAGVNAEISGSDSAYRGFATLTTSALVLRLQSGTRTRQP